VAPVRRNGPGTYRMARALFAASTRSCCREAVALEHFTPETSWRKVMKRLVLSALLLGSIAAAAPALAQAVVVSPEYDVRLRGLAVGPSVTVAEPLAVGTVLPADVALAPLPEDVDVSLRPYRYVVWNGRTVLVEPGTRRVIRVVE
jgi:hypothetical protein